MAAAQGAEPGAVRYRERLHPSPLLWLAPAGLAAFLGVAYAYALGPLPGVVTFAILLGLGLWVVGRTAALVEVDDEVLRAGRARLPLEFVGRVRALDEAASALARGRGGDARHTCCCAPAMPARAWRWRSPIRATPYLLADLYQAP